MKVYIKIVSAISFVAVVVGLIIWRIDRKSEFQQETGRGRLKNAKIEAPGKIGNMKVDFNGTVIDVTLSLDDLDGGVDLVKWAWPAGLPKEPMWFRAFQAMSDPRKFEKFDDYRNFTTREWREETKTDRPEDFDRWKQEAVVGSEVHDAKKVTINRAVFVKILDMEYVFLAVQKEALSPLTNKMSTSNTIAAIVREDGELKCADIGKNCLVIADPRESGEIQKMIESSRAVISGGVLRSR